MKERLVISINDFRRLTGKDTARFNDEQVEEIIQQLDFLAEMYINQAIASKEGADKLDKQK